VSVLKNTTDIIEHYLKSILEKNQEGTIEIKRNEVAEKFQCVPSQINYVINTRFTVERGYAVESKRGGGGYIRIYQIELNSKKAVLDHATAQIQTGASYQMAEDVVYMLLKEEMITTREAELMLAAVERDVLAYPIPERDHLRASILDAMLNVLLYDKK